MPIAPKISDDCSSRTGKPPMVADESCGMLVPMSAPMAP
jgi:hypothetical protein